MLQEFREANALAEQGAAGLFRSWPGEMGIGAAPSPAEVREELGQPTGGARPIDRRWRQVYRALLGAMRRFGARGQAAA